MSSCRGFKEYPIRLFFAVMALFSGLTVPSALATPLDGTGGISPRSLVSGITAVDSALAEVKNKDRSPIPDQVLTTRSTKPLNGGPHIKLSDRFEAVAGSDHLISLSDVLRQTSFFAEARYRLSDTIQVGGSIGVRVQGSEIASDVAAQLLVGPTFNFLTGGGLKNAFFISPKIGLTAERQLLNGSTVASGTRATAAVIAGKRFALNDRVMYSPSVGVVMQAGAAPYFVVVPLAVSVLF